MKRKNLIAYSLLQMGNPVFQILAPGLGLVWVAGAIICLLMPMSWLAVEGVLLVVVWLAFKVLGIAVAYLAFDMIYSLMLYYRNR